MLERKLIQQAFSLNRSGKMLVTVIDDAHLMDMENLRKLRLMLEDFPKNHNLILIGQVELLTNLDLAVNQDIKSRVTYSVITKRLHDDAMRDFIERQLDAIGLGHNTFTSGSMELIIRTADGVLRRCRNLCLASMLEAVRASAGREIDIDLVNRVLMLAALAKRSRPEGLLKIPLMSLYTYPRNLMITRELLRAIRNDLPMKLTLTRLGHHGPRSKEFEGYFRFQCPHCDELRATVNPKNNLAHCFSCGQNTNNIDLLMLLGHDFVPAVTILRNWLEQYRRDLGQEKASVDSDSPATVAS